MIAVPRRGLHGLGSRRRRAGDPAGAGPVSRPAATTGAGTAATVAALTVTLGPAAACWVVAVWQMNGMDMGVATRVGPFGVFLAVWAAMMAAMMQPGVALQSSGAPRPAWCTPRRYSSARTWPCGQRQAWRCTRWTGRTDPWPQA